MRSRIVSPAERRTSSSPSGTRRRASRHRGADQREHRARAGARRRRSRRRTPTRRGRRAAAPPPPAAPGRRRPRSPPGAGGSPIVRCGQLGDPVAQRWPASRRSAAGSSWLPAAVWISTVASPKRLPEQAALGLDVLHARHRDQRPAHDEDAAPEVDLVLAHLPAPAPPAQLGHERRADHAARPAARAHAERRQRRRGSASPTPCRASDQRGDRAAAPSRAATPSGPRGASRWAGSGSALHRPAVSCAAVPTAFVTGGSGFVGGALIRRLVARRLDACARSRARAAAEATVREAGAEPVRGDLDDGAALDARRARRRRRVPLGRQARRLGRRGTSSGASTSTAPRRVIAACRVAGVQRLVHVGTEAALLHGQPLVAADERTPLAFDSPAPYSATKAEAEAAVIERQRRRPGDRRRAAAVRLGRRRHDAAAGAHRRWPAPGSLRWIGGGRQLTSTTHVENTVEGLVLAAERGHPGNAYFVTDGSPVVFREFVSRAGRHPGRAGARGRGPAAGRPRARRRRRGGLARCCRCPASRRCRPLRAVGLRARVHDRRLARRASSSATCRSSPASTG